MKLEEAASKQIKKCGSS